VRLKLKCKKCGLEFEIDKKRSDEIREMFWVSIDQPIKRGAIIQFGSITCPGCNNETFAVVDPQ